MLDQAKNHAAFNAKTASTSSGSFGMAQLPAKPRPTRNPRNPTRQDSQAPPKATQGQKHQHEQSPKAPPQCPTLQTLRPSSHEKKNLPTLTCRRGGAFVAWHRFTEPGLWRQRTGDASLERKAAGSCFGALDEISQTNKKQWRQY